MSKISLLKTVTILFCLLFQMMFWNSPALAQSSDSGADSGELDESFDPFSDYNEFEQQSEEESDINFLKNGRYLTLALVSGYRGFTGGMSTAYSGGLTTGVQFSYFFDLNIAASFGYTTGDYGVSFDSFSDQNFQSFVRNYSGSVNLQIFDLQIKYYPNTDNVTKGLADLNPYFLTGAGFFTRTYSLNNSFNDSPDRATGLRLGGGIEIPLEKRRFYLGLQALYTYVQFQDENYEFIEELKDSYYINPQLDGDTYEINVILGTNF